MEAALLPMPPIGQTNFRNYFLPSTMNYRLHTVQETGFQI